MLILTRRPGPDNDAVRINVPTPDGWRTIRVVVLGYRGREVRLGFQATGDVVFIREELIGREERT